MVDTNCKILADACRISKKPHNPCDTARFIEIVKGKFSGIEDSEIAHVVWSGDHRDYPDLLYEARCIRNHKKILLSGNKLWLERNNKIQQYFVLKNKKLDRYVFQMKDNNNKVIRYIEYFLKPTKREKFPHLKLDYPDNSD